MLRLFLAAICGLFLLIKPGVPSVHAASVEIEFRTATAICGSIEHVDACAAIPRPTDGATVLDGFVTTDADILSLRNFEVTELPDGREIRMYDVDPPFGSDTSPPDPAFVALNRALELDSWVTTPGDTEWVLPPGVDAGPWWSSGGLFPFEDDSDDGPQDRFHFTRLTFMPASGGVFSGEIVVAGSTGPESFVFSLVVPEPTALMLVGLGLVGSTVFRSRR